MRLRSHVIRAVRWLTFVSKRDPSAFAHWRYVRP
jgi:hypothetical protein